MRRLPALFTLAATLAVAAPAVPAQAARTASTGEVCTQVGTSRADVLRGTAGRDVLCGLGGNDTLYGFGGNDVLDGGYGADKVYGAGGDDKLTGGTGDDRLAGAIGQDTIRGGPGDDTLSGGTGADREYGGTGDDRVSGNAGNDLILGQDDDDAIDGGDGGDTIYGGDGYNWCVEDSADETTRCVYDETAPVIRWAVSTVDSVDVTEQDRRVTLRMRVTDDTLVRSVSFNAWPEEGIDYDDYTHRPRLVEGSSRDGIWSATMTVRRYAPPGPVNVWVYAYDRLGRRTTKLFPEALTVVDRAPDKAHPVVSEATASRSAVDVRTAGVTVTVDARIKDDRSGVENAWICAPGDCADLQRVSGSLIDGRWRATVTIPKGVPTGDHYLEFDVRDRIHGQNMSPVRLPLAVVGADPPKQDEVEPTITALRAETVSVDTKTAPAVVRIYARVTDAADEGIERLTGWIGTYGEVHVTAVTQSPYQGTRTDGWWKLTFTVPQGVPPGRYPVTGIVPSDGWHATAWHPPASPYLADGRAIPPGAVQTTDGKPWDGAITVVAPSG